MKMDFFIGNKTEIGAEIKVIDRDEHNALMGYARLWFGGYFLGSFFDYIYLDGYLLGGLFQMLRVGEMKDGNFPSEIEAQFYYFQNKADDIDDDEIDSYRVSFGTLTDSFNIWAYKKGEDITIVWKIVEGHSVYEDLQTYPIKTFSYTMKYSEFKEFVERLDRILANW